MFTVTRCSLAAAVPLPIDQQLVSLRRRRDPTQPEPTERKLRWSNSSRQTQEIRSSYLSILLKSSKDRQAIATISFYC